MFPKTYDIKCIELLHSTDQTSLPLFMLFWLLSERERMGRKRMAETTFHEGKISNDCLETTIATMEKHSHSSSANTSEAVNAGNSNGLSAKKSNTRAMDVVVRRSCRLMNSSPRSERLLIKPTMGHINISESKGEEIPIVQQANTGPILNERVMSEELALVQPVVTAPISNKKTMEAEIPHVLSVGTVSIVNDKKMADKFEFLIKVFDEFVSKTDKQVKKALNEDSFTDLNYKSLYIGSQKKMEGLMEENFHLSRKLEFALGKIEAYEKMTGIMCASKEVVLFSNPSPRKKHVSQSRAASHAVIGHETSSPEPKKRTRTYKNKMRSLDIDA
ncbi:uncharacterized protein [Primulina huaijiensis]|uniref:uncharacterized protein isoform X2 n=1 Tax=Primulina huaijiensis TaxID=1492673 RepID=UPI003CC71DDB